MKEGRKFVLVIGLKDKDYLKKLKELRKEKIDYDIILEWNTTLDIWGFKYEGIGDKNETNSNSPR